MYILFANRCMMNSNNNNKNNNNDNTIFKQGNSIS